jgi:hypothetical protein
MPDLEEGLRAASELESDSHRTIDPVKGARAVSVGRVLTAIVLVIIGLAFLVLLCLTQLWIDRAKLVLSAFMLTLSVLFLWVLFNKQRLLDELALQEMLADDARDDAMFELTAARSRLSQIERRLVTSTQPAPPARVNKLLVQYASSAVMMVIQKEKSFIQWGFWAAKVGRSMYQYFQNRSNH